MLFDFLKEYETQKQKEEAKEALASLSDMSHLSTME